MGLKSFILEQEKREKLKEEFLFLVEELNILLEKSKSKSQQRFMGMVHKCKKTGDCASKEVKDAADSMTGKAAKDFAKTKHKGLPDKVEEDIEEDGLSESSKKRKNKSKKKPVTKLPDPEKRVIGNPNAAGEIGKYKKSSKYKRRKDKQKGYEE